MPNSNHSRAEQRIFRASSMIYLAKTSNLGAWFTGKRQSSASVLAAVIVALVSIAYLALVPMPTCSEVQTIKVGNVLMGGCQ